MTLTADDPDVVADAAVLAARRSPGRMAAVCGRGVYQYAPHIQALDEAIVRAIAKDEGRLIVSVSVRAGKSVLTSRWTPAWFLGRYPDRRVILACHDVSLAAEHAGAARDILTEYGPTVFGIEVDPGSSARHRWDIARHDGGMLALGVGGSPIGRGSDLTLVDDPLKSWEMAQNPDMRKKINETWWQGTMSSRLESGGTVIVICSRWHEDDLSGFLQREYPGEWDELRIPALCDNPATDPLGREPGESFWPERWSRERLLRREREVGPRVWLAQYQQKPSAEEGELFPVGKLRYIDAAELADRSIVWCRGWDLAATEDGGDYTRGVKIGRYQDDGRWVIGDGLGGQWGESTVRAELLATAIRDGHGCLIEFPQDPGQAGKAQAAQISAALSGYLVESRPQTGAKEVRAAGLAAQVQAGNVDIVRGEWNHDLVAELSVFPNGAHDDYADSAAVAFNRIAGVPLAESGVGSDAFGGMQRQTM